MHTKLLSKLTLMIVHSTGYKSDLQYALTCSSHCRVNW